MNKFATIAGLAAAATTMSASADLLLSVDLSVANEMTISSVVGNSSASATASNFTGFLLAGFLNTAGAGPAIADGVGNLSTANNASDFGPSIFNGGFDFGINVWNFSTDTTVSVTAGSQAFDGSATWAVDAGVYAALMAGNLSGDIIFDADTDDDLGTNIGTWEVKVIPAPGSLALLGLGGIAAGRRRR